MSYTTTVAELFEALPHTTEALAVPSEPLTADLGDGPFRLASIRREAGGYLLTGQPDSVDGGAIIDVPAADGLTLNLAAV